MKELIGYISFVLIMVSLGIVLGICFTNLYERKSEKLDLEVNDLNCSKIDLFTTTQCIKKDLDKWYYYNISNVGKDISLEQLKKEGGVCSHWATYWISQLKDKFYTKKIVIDTDEKTRHAFAVASDESGYCLLDEQNVECFKFINGEKYEKI